MRRIIAVLFVFLLLMQVFGLACKIQSVRADTEKLSQSPISSNPQYGGSNTTENNQKTIEAQPTIVQSAMNESELQLLEARTGIRNEGQNYNQVVKGHGTGLAPPSEEEWKLIENEASVADQISISGQSPSSWDNMAEPWFPPIGDQGQEGSCVAWAVGYYTKTFQEAKEHNWNVNSGAMQNEIMSPSFIYNLIDDGVDKGSYYSDAIGLICSVGDCSLSTMPYNAGDYTSWPSEIAWKEAPLYRANASSINLYMMLQDDAGLAKLKTWLSSGNLAIVSVDAHKIQDPTWGWSLLDGNDMLTLDNYVNPSTNHAGTIVGYDDNFAYTEAGQTHYGAFKIANSWGIPWLPSPFSWEHICDGCYWISYEAMKQRVSFCMICSDLLNYTPQLVATFGINHNNRGECSITVGAGTVDNPIVTKSFNSYIHGGNVPFCHNDILLDVTEFKDVLTKAYDQQYFLQVYDGGSITVGTVTKFCINHAQSADTPLYTVNNNFVVSNLVLTKMIVPDQYPTIQNAISSAWSGDAIFVRAGTYYENVVIDKAIELIGENDKTTIMDGKLAGNVITITANLVKVSGFTIRNSGTNGSPCGIYCITVTGNNISGNIITSNCYGVYLYYSSNNSISGNSMTDSYYGIILYYSSNNNVSENNATNNEYGFWLGSSSFNSISGNNAANNESGIILYSSSFNSISGNNIANNQYGIVVDSSSSNKILHNNFVNNNTPVYIPASGYANIWDDGYSFGGNYWSDYLGTDTNNDGIGDTPYVIDMNNIDHYPLMKPWTPNLFYDGFESGTFNAWTGTSVSSGEIAATANTPTHHGIYSAKYSSNGGGGTEYAYSYKTMASSTELYARSYFYVSQSGIADESDRFYTIIFKAGSNSVAYAGWKKTGGLVQWSLVIRSGTSYVYAYSANVPSMNHWYCVELHWKEDAAAGLGELWVDGSLVCSITGVNTGTYGALTQVAFGLPQITNCASTTVFCDCVVVSRAYVGPEPQVPTPPYVSSHVPIANATNVAVTSSIQVTFSEPMDTSSVQNAFTVNPSVSGSFTWSSGDAVLTFSPSSSLVYQTLYTITISTGAKDQLGQNMLSPSAWGFTTEQAGQTSGTFGKKDIGSSVSNLCAYSYGSRYQMTENGVAQSLTLYVQEATGSATALKVALYSDNAGVPSTLIAQGTATVSANYLGWVTVNLTSKPSLSAGAYYWLMADAKVSGKTLRFYYSTGATNQGVYGTTSYASFPANPCQYSARNARVYSIYCTYLTTAPSAPTVVNHVPSSDATGVSTSTSIQVTFSEPMDQTSTQNAFTISPSVSGSFTWTVGDTVMTFTPNASLAQGTLYTISISAAAQSKTAKSLVPCSWSFQTANAGVTETFGKIDVGASQTNLCQYFYGSRYQVSKNGVAQSISIRVSEGNGEARTVKVGIYSDAGGAPGNLLASGTGTVPAGTNGWVTVALTTTPNLSAGAYYWLVVDAMASGKTLRFYYSTGSTNQSIYGTTSLASFPTNSLTYAGFKDRAYSIYCSYLTS